MILQRNEQKEPLISVILPCYNHEKYVADAIESILNQTYSNMEIIVANNGSTDGSEKVIRRYESEINNIIVLERNDIYSCVTQLQDRCHGKYVAMMHADDYWEPEKLEKQVMGLHQHPDCVAAFTWADYCDENLNRLDSDELYSRNRSRMNWIHDLMIDGNCLSYPSVLIEREVLLNVRCQLYPWKKLGDWNMWLEVLKSYGNIYIIEEVLVKMRRHENNMSAINPLNIAQNHLEWGCIWQRILDSMDDEIFIGAFQKEFLYQDAHSREELLCEKLFLLLRAGENNPGMTSTAMSFYQKCFHNPDAAKILREKYHYTLYHFWKFLENNAYVSWISNAIIEEQSDQKKALQIKTIVEQGRMVLQKINRYYEENTAIENYTTLLDSLISLEECLQELAEKTGYVEFKMTAEEKERLKQYIGEGKLHILNLQDTIIPVIEGCLNRWEEKINNVIV